MSKFIRTMATLLLTSLVLVACGVANTPAGGADGAPVSNNDNEDYKFTVRIENVSDENTLPTSQGSVAVPLSPGAYIVHQEDFSPLLEPRDPAGAALEALAEDGNAGLFPDEVAGAKVFNTPVGATEPGPLFPGGAYEFEVTAKSGDKLSLATMFVQSNDWFYTSTDEDDSIDLFDADGKPINADVSDQVSLWESATEVDEEPGTGPNQAPRQAGPNTGESEVGKVGSLKGKGKSVTLNGQVIRITITPDGQEPAPAPQPEPQPEPAVEATSFRAFVLNTSTATTLKTSQGEVPVPLSPGAWVVHNEPAPLFKGGQADFGYGLEAIAEDGSAAELAQFLAGKYPNKSGAFNTPLGSENPAPAFPNDIYSFTFDAVPGEKLSFATMFVQSNDWFYAPGGQGIALFDDAGEPIQGDVSDYVKLWDAGTEVNQEAGTGSDQAPRQSGPNVGKTENGTVELVDPRPATDGRVLTVYIMPVDDSDKDLTVFKDVELSGTQEVPAIKTPASGNATAVRYGDLAIVLGSYQDLEGQLLPLGGAPAHVHNGTAKSDLMMVAFTLTYIQMLTVQVSFVVKLIT